MSRPVLTLPGTYTLIVEMENTTDATANWRNTWDIEYPSGAPIDDNDPVIAGIKAFQLANLRSDAFIKKLTLRNWSQGPQPFATRPFIWEVFPAPQELGKKLVAPPDGYGNVGSPTIGGEVVLFCKRGSGLGKRPTNMFLRGLLDMTDVQSENGGKWSLKPTGGNVNATFFSQIVTAHLAPYFNPGSGMPQLVIVHVGNHYVGPASASPMTSLSLVGVTTNRQTRKNKR